MLVRFRYMFGKNYNWSLCIAKKKYIKCLEFYKT
jgi:hypothetical protein